MLTADLAMSWQRGSRTGPRLIDTRDPRRGQVAADLIEIVRRHCGRRRAELDAALEEYVGTGTDYRILRGLIKLLLDRCAFETPAVIDPAEIRRVLFLTARQQHPVIPGTGARAEVIARAADELNCRPEDVIAGVYADLTENQKLASIEELTAEELLHRYNLAQAQALLYRCVSLRLWVEPQDPAGYRQLFEAIKAYRLIHTIEGDAAAGYKVRLDGPVSMFHRTQKYGIQMAAFLPALLACRAWRMRAEIAQKTGGNLYYELDSGQDKLRSYYAGEVSFESEGLERFAAAWTRDPGAWTLHESREVIDLGHSAFIPDFVLRREDGEDVYLEVLGFWTPRYVRDRLAEFARAGFKRFLLAASDELRASREAAPDLGQHVIVFKTALDPERVRERLEALSGDSQQV